MTLLLAVALFAWAGLGVLAFAAPRHHARVCALPLTRRQRAALRALASALLLLALMAAIARDGISFGVLLYVALLGVAGMALVVLLAYRPHLAFLGTGARMLCRLAAKRRCN